MIQDTIYFLTPCPPFFSFSLKLALSFLDSTVLLDTPFKISNDFSFILSFRYLFPPLFVFPLRIHYSSGFQRIFSGREGYQKTEKGSAIPVVNREATYLLKFSIYSSVGEQRRRLNSVMPCFLMIIAFLPHLGRPPLFVFLVLLYNLSFPLILFWCFT